MLLGMGVLSHSGKRVTGFLVGGDGVRGVRSSRASDAGSWVGGVVTKVEKSGPVLRRSWKDVRGREGSG